MTRGATTDGTDGTDRDAERLRLAATFDRVADRYQRARPEYPDALFDHLLAVTGLQPPARLLEVGCATGKATLPLARKGFHLTCLEPGPALAAAARANLEGLPVTVHEARLEDWTPDQPGSDPGFDLVLAATAWHWVDPVRRYGLAARLLPPGAHLAFWSATHVLPDGGDPFFAELQPVYEEIGEGLPPGATTPRPQQLPAERDDVEARGLFRVVDVAQFDWETVHDADSYLDLLDTFSGHIAMQPWQRERLYGEIRRRLAERPAGTLRRHWGAVLLVARRLPA